MAVETVRVSAPAPFPGRLFEPVDGDPALRWKGSASPETTMTTENPIPSRQRDPWNKGRLIGQKRPLKPKDVWTIRVCLELEGRKRDLAMFNLAVDSKLRGCDIVRLKIDAVSADGRVRDRATVNPDEGRPTGSVRNHRANPERYRRLAVQPREHKGSVLVPEPFPAAAAPLDTPVRASSIDGLSAPVSIVRPMARTRSAERSRLTFSRILATCARCSCCWPHEAGEYRPLSRD